MFLDQPKSMMKYLEGLVKLVADDCILPSQEALQLQHRGYDRRVQVLVSDVSKAVLASESNLLTKVRIRVKSLLNSKLNWFTNTTHEPCHTQHTAMNVVSRCRVD